MVILTILTTVQKIRITISSEGMEDEDGVMSREACANIDVDNCNPGLAPPPCLDCSSVKSNKNCCALPICMPEARSAIKIARLSNLSAVSILRAEPSWSASTLFCRASVCRCSTFAAKAVVQLSNIWSMASLKLLTSLLNLEREKRPIMRPIKRKETCKETYKEKRDL